MSAIPKLTPEQIAALPPVAPGHVRHILNDPVVITFTPTGGEAREEVLAYVDLRVKVKGKDMRATDAHPGPVAKQMALVARLIGQPFAVVDEMAAEDLTALMELSENPTQPGHQTGGAPAG